MNAKDANAVVRYFRHLAESQKDVPIESALRGLAQLYSADAIGMNGVEPTTADCSFGLQTTPRSFPWQTKAELLERLQSSLCAELHQDAAGHWLISLVWEPGSGEPQLVWALRSSAWNETDRWSWMAASEALLRRRMQRVSQAILLQRRLELAARVTGRLSHDFGNCLTGILGFTELSLTQAPADGLLHGFLQEVLRAAKHGADWVRRLHLFCRRGALTVWPTPLKQVLIDEETRLRSTGGFNLHWETDVPANLPLVDIDAGELQIVIAELVNNAREACKEQGTIKCTARVLTLRDADCRDLLGAIKSGPHVELTLADDGPGFAAEDRANFGSEIFSSTKARQRGLGLLILYGCMLRYRAGLRIGTINGQGTAMQLYLPVAAMPAAQADAAASHLLLVNANPLFCESMRIILEAGGFRVRTASSAAMALNAFTTPRQSFALVVIDVLLHEKSGFDLARRMLDYDAKANFLFLHTTASFHGLGQEEMVQRFPMLRWPLATQSFLHAIQAALTGKEAPHDIVKEK